MNIERKVPTCEQSFLRIAKFHLNLDIAGPDLSSISRSRLFDPGLWKNITEAEYSDLSDNGWHVEKHYARLLGPLRAVKVWLLDSGLGGKESHLTSPSVMGPLLNGAAVAAKPEEIKAKGLSVQIESVPGHLISFEDDGAVVAIRRSGRWETRMFESRSFSDAGVVPGDWVSVHLGRNGDEFGIYVEPLPFRYSRDTSRLARR